MTVPRGGRPTEPRCASHSVPVMTVAVCASVPGVDLEDAVRTQPIDPDLLEPLRTGLGQVPDGTQRGQVVGVTDLFGKPPDPLHHRRDEVDGVRTGSGRWTSQRGLGVETRKDDDVAPAQPCRAGPDDRTVVVQRCRHDHAAAGHPEERWGVLVVESWVAGHDQLRPARRPARRRCLPCRRGDVGERAVATGPGSGRYPAGSVRRPSASSGETPITAEGFASSRIACSSRSGRWAGTGWGMAPIFQQAATATYHSVELGRATVTMSPSSVAAGGQVACQAVGGRLELGSGEAVLSRR